MDKCFNACECDGEPVSQTTRHTIKAEVHRQLDQRRFRPERIVDWGGPASMPREHRILWVTARILWGFGIRSNLPQYLQLTASLSDPVVATTKA